MILTKLILTNFCQFPRLEFDYEPGVTGITGENGKGKSNFLDAGQYFALTGKTSENVKKEDLLRWKQQKGSAELHFTDGGNRFVLTRSLQSSSVRLEFLDMQEEKRGKVINKVLKNAAANAHMESVLGMKAELFYETCFVPQGKLWNVVMMTHAERMRYFQRITGMMRAETLRGILQESGINQIPVYIDRTTEIGDIEKELLRIRQDILKHRKMIRKLDDLQKKFDDTLPEAQRILSMPLVEEVARKLTEARTKVASALSERDQFLKTHELEDRTPIAGPTELQRKQRRGYEQYMDAVKNWKDAVKAHKEASAALKETTNAKEHAARQEQIKNLRDETQELAADMKNLQRDIDLAIKGICPTCGREYDGASADELKKVLEQKRAENAEKTALLTTLNRDDSEYMKRTTQAAEKEKNASSEARKWRDKVVQFQEFENFDVDAYDRKNEEWLDYQKHLQRVAAFLEEQKKLDAAVHSAELELGRVEGIKTVTKEQKDKAEKLIANEKNLGNDIIQLTAKLAMSEQRRKDAQERLRQYTDEAEKSDRLKKVKVLFENARAMYHREELPKVVMSYVLVKLNRSLDRFVQFFDLPFVAEINENFDFVTHYPTKSNFPASRSSGGQRVALAIAYHLAWAEALSGSVPLMVLDEPTNHLDQDHKRQICEVLRRIQQVASKGTIFQVATHDPILYPAFTRQREIDELVVSR